VADLDRRGSGTRGDLGVACSDRGHADDACPRVQGVFRARSGRRAWTAFHELVTLSTESDSETRSDSDRRFERTVLASAPAGAVPESFVG